MSGRFLHKAKPAEQGNRKKKKKQSPTFGGLPQLAPV